MVLFAALVLMFAPDAAADKKVAALEAEYKANPQSAKVKAQLVGALLAQGDGLMADEALPPRAKYPAALRAYRQVLVYDKANAKAKSNVETIEGIYKSMGRPVPQ